jgi:hypothetical protein
MASPAYTILPAPHDAATQTPEGAPQPGALSTDADRLRAIYKDVGVEQKHTYGEGTPGSKPPDFTKIPSVHGVLSPGGSAAAPNAPGQASAAQPGAAKAPAQAQTGPAAGPAQTGQTKPVLPPKPAVPAVAKPKPPVSEGIDDEPASVVAPAPPAPNQ